MAFRSLKHKSLELINWSFDKGLITGMEVLELAAELGNTELMEQYIEKGFSPDQNIANIAGFHEKSNILDLLSAMDINPNNVDVAESAAETGNIDLLDRFEKLGLLPTYEAAVEAPLNCLKWMRHRRILSLDSREVKYSLSARYRKALNEEDYPTLDWLYAKDIEPNDLGDVFSYSLQVKIWLITHKFY